MPAGSSESLAEEALGQASWQGLARELAWRAVTGGQRDARQVEPLAARAEAMLASLFDQALWEVERRAVESWHEYRSDHRGDREAALTAARLDAGEEATRLVDAAYDSVLDTLLSTSRRAA